MSGSEACPLCEKRHKLTAACSLSIIESIDHICTYDFYPNEEDVMRCHRQAAKGIEEHFIRLSPIQIMRICDVAGTKGKRPVWIKFFEDGER